MSAGRGVSFIPKEKNNGVSFTPRQNNANFLIYQKKIARLFVIDALVRLKIIFWKLKKSFNLLFYDHLGKVVKLKSDEN